MEYGSVEEITKSFGLSQGDVEVWSKRSGQSSGKLANPGFNKTEAGCVCVCVSDVSGCSLLRITGRSSTSGFTETSMQCAANWTRLQFTLMPTEVLIYCYFCLDIYTGCPPVTESHRKFVGNDCKVIEF